MIEKCFICNKEFKTDKLLFMVITVSLTTGILKDIDNEDFSKVKTNTIKKQTPVCKMCLPEYKTRIQKAINNRL